jgi:hypothetical protein
VLEHFEDAELHQHQRNSDVEDQPDHAAGMAVRQTRKEIRPGDRACVGVGDIDFELRNDDESAGKSQCHLRRGEDISKCHEIHPRGFGRRGRRHEMLNRKKCQERAREQFQHAGHDPAGTCRQIGEPPAGPAATFARRQKSEEVDLLADLRDEREHHRRRCSKQQEIKGAAFVAGHSGEIRPPFE